MGFLNDNDKELIDLLYEECANYWLDKIEESVKTASTESRFNNFLCFLDAIKKDPTFLETIGENREKRLEKILRNMSGFPYFNIKNISKYDTYAALIKVKLNMTHIVEMNTLKPRAEFFYANEKYIKIKPVQTKVGLFNAISYDYAECVWIDPRNSSYPY